jgi:methyltransferase (TIGR00027 family)
MTADVKSTLAVMRTAGDTWDIVTSVGFTALSVCAARALDAALTPPLANDDYAAAFVTAAGEPALATAVAENDVNSAPAFNARWVGVRTRFFDDFFTRAAQSSIRQVVILAAGLDSRAYRLPWQAGTRVFEVDQPKVLEFKQRVLDETGAVSSAGRITVPVDLRDDWPTALRRAGFDPGEPSAWAAEGLLPYLPGAAQDDLFEHLHELAAVGSALAVELGPEPGEIQEFHDDLPSDGDDLPRVGDLWYDDARRDAKVWLAEHDWAVTSVDLLDKAAHDYGRALNGLPTVFERMMRTKYFTATRSS